MIQQGVNQLINTIGLAARLSPDYEIRQEASDIYKRGLSAQTGLRNIKKNLEEIENPDPKNPKAPYSQRELADISNRVSEHVHNIGTLKTAVLEGQPTAPFIPKKGDHARGLIPRENYSKDLNYIEEALERMRNRASIAIDQDNRFQTARSIILELDQNNRPISREE